MYALFTWWEMTCDRAIEHDDCLIDPVRLLSSLIRSVKY